MFVRDSGSIMNKEIISAIDSQGTKTALDNGIGTLATQNFPSLCPSEMNLTTRTLSTDTYDTQVRAKNFIERVNETIISIEKITEKVKSIAQQGTLASQEFIQCCLLGTISVLLFRSACVLDNETLIDAVIRKLDL